MDDKAKTRKYDLLNNSMQIPRVSDSIGNYIHFNRGIRAGSIHEDAWSIEPLYADEKAMRSGLISKKQLEAFAHQYQLKAVAFQNFHWTNGAYHSTWTPILPTNKNHMLSPSSTWGSIASNIRSPRLKKFLKNKSSVDINELATQMDDQDHYERFARSICSSLRSVDISIEQIAEFYNEQLVDLLISKKKIGTCTSRPMDQNLYAHIHSFYLHLGAARDYLGALIGFDLFPKMEPNKRDSMARLLGKLNTYEEHPNKILRYLKSEKLIELKFENKKRKWKLSGWLKEATDMRNDYVHRVPFGQNFNESFGETNLVDGEIGLYQYQRPYFTANGKKSDIFDLLIEHYHKATYLFQEAAKLTGQNTEMITLTGKDIISIDIKHNPTDK